MRRIAYLRRLGEGAGASRPGLVFLGGFNSNMRGVKATFFDRAAQAAGRAYLRFDYSGHGESERRLEEGAIGTWLEESLAVLRRLTNGPQVLIGSSMGAWLALLIARAFNAAGESGRLAGLVLIAPAVDFTERLLWDQMPPKARAELEEKGVWMRDSTYSPKPYPISKHLIEEGRKHLLLDGLIRAYCPLRVIHGQEDKDAPWRYAMTLVEHLAGDPVSFTLVRGGDHRLAREEDLALEWAAAESMG